LTLEIGTQKVGRVRKRGNAGPAISTSLPIGEVDANIFACPACQRPLDTGTTRCPGCSARLIGGVKASRAGVFVGIGVFTGMIASGALMGLGSLVSPRPVETATIQPPAVVTPSQAPAASAPAVAVDPGIPSSAMSALGQSARLNQRVLADAERLTIALAAAKPSSAEIAPILRTLATTASFGARLAPSVGDWDKASAVSADLATFYADIAATAQQGLSSSLSSSRAYQAAAERMLEVVSRVSAIDAASRALGAAAGIELAPLRPPSP
jgi:hypothetical protein